MHISVYHCKQHLSRLLALVRAGESIDITNRGIVVARLVPFTSQEQQKQPETKNADQTL